MRKYSALGLLAVALAGCTMEPKYERPALPVAGQWPQDPAYQWTGTNSQPNLPANTVAAEIGWREFFQDPRLNRIVALALENNRDLRVALLNVETVRAEYQVAEAALIPNLSVNANSLCERTPIGFTDNGQAITFSQYNVNLATTSYEVDLWGRVRSLRKEAIESFLATEEARITAQISLVAQVAIQYLTSRELDELLAVSQQTLESNQAYYNLIRQVYEIGNTAELDLRSAEAQVQTARAAVADFTRQRAQSENALLLLVGTNLPADLPPPEPLDSQRLLADLPAGLPSDLLERRPDIRGAEHTLRSANASIGAARAAFFPKLTLTAAGGTTSLQLAGLFEPGSLAWSFSPQITLPIFDSGVNRANLDISKINKRIEIAQYEKAIQTAFREVADALAARATYDEQIDALQALTVAQQQRFTLADARYRNGVDNYLGVLTAQQDLFRAQLVLIQSRFARLANLVSLYQALGGGWRDYMPADQAATFQVKGGGAGAAAPP